jgi:hypothetical protein
MFPEDGELFSNNDGISERTSSTSFNSRLMSSLVEKISLSNSDLARVSMTYLSFDQEMHGYSAIINFQWRMAIMMKSTTSCFCISLPFSLIAYLVEADRSRR